MNWKYYISHVWDSPRTLSQDVLLLPGDLDYKGGAVWLRVDALASTSDPTYAAHWPKFRKEALEKLRENGYWIDAARVIVKATDFSKAELLEWVITWLRETGFRVAALTEASIEDFAEILRELLCDQETDEVVCVVKALEWVV